MIQSTDPTHDILIISDQQHKNITNKQLKLAYKKFLTEYQKSLQISEPISTMLMICFNEDELRILQYMFELVSISNSKIEMNIDNTKNITKQLEKKLTKFIEFIFNVILSCPTNNYTELTQTQCLEYTYKQIKREINKAISNKCPGMSL